MGGTVAGVVGRGLIHDVGNAAAGDGDYRPVTIRSRPIGRRAFYCFEQLLRRGFDITIAELTRASFDRKQTATMNDREIAEGKFVMRLAFSSPRFIDGEVPFSVFGQAMRPNEFIFSRGRWFVPAPIAVPISGHVALLDQLACKSKRVLIQTDRSAVCLRDHRENKSEYHLHTLHA